MTTRYRVTTPVPDFVGLVGNCMFHAGRYMGPVEEGPLAYFRAQGYGVDELDADGNAVVRDEDGEVVRVVELDERGDVVSAEGDAPESPEAAPPVGETPPEVSNKVPAKSASKADWIAYAETQGMPLGEAEGYTRDELAVRFAPVKEGPTT